MFHTNKKKMSIQGENQQGFYLPELVEDMATDWNGLKILDDGL